MGEGVKRPQPDLSFDDLHKQAQESMPLLERSAQNLLDRLKAQNSELFKDVIFEMGPLKTRERALVKIEKDYGSDPREIKDLVRGRFVVDTPEQIAALKKALLEERDIDSMKDKYERPSSDTGYRDLNTKVALENGHIAEIQIQQRDMLRVNKPTHNLMEQRQDIIRQAASETRMLSPAEENLKNTIESQAKELHAAAAHDGHLDELLKPELREKFSYKGPLDAEGSALGKLAEKFSDIGKKGGVVAGIALGTLSGVFTLTAGGTKEQAAKAVYETAVPYGETQIDLAKGDTKAAARSATVETASNLGSLGGAAAGAVTGAAIGSVIPVIGTAAGGVVGGIVGGISGGVVVSKASEYMIDHYEEIKGKALHVSHDAVAKLTAATQEVKSLLGSTWDLLAGNKKPELDMQTAFNKLPNAVKQDMPPEVASLIEIKKSPALFEKQFKELKAHGGLDEVAGYIEKHLLSPALATEPVTSNAAALTVRTATLNL